MSGADLANLCNEAALMAARRNARVVEMQDFEKAKDKIFMGPERKSMVMPEEERRNTAYHESGHALIGKLLPKCDPVHKVTIIPRGRALGVTMSLPAQDRYSYDREYMLNQISMLFGGRIAEEVFMHQMTTGASNDFERATHLARDMVMRYGMTDALGPMVYAENEGEVFLGRSVTKTTNISESTMQKVDAEVRRIIDEQYALARRLIEENSDKMHAMAKALLEWETIDTEQLDDIMAGKEPRPPKDWTPRTPPSGSGGSGWLAGCEPIRRRPPRKRAQREGRQRGLRPRFFLVLSENQAMHWQTSRFQIDLSQPRVMGIVNVTPDSFSDGGRYASTRSALAHCEKLLVEGADILDIGGESTRPGSLPVPLEEELARVLPVLRDAVTLGVPISVDTYKPEVMRAALDIGRRHRQRHLGAAATRRARGGGGAPPVRRLPDAHARRTADHAAFAHGGRCRAAGASLS